MILYVYNYMYVYVYVYTQNCCQSFLVYHGLKKRVPYCYSAILRRVQKETHLLGTQSRSSYHSQYDEI